MIDHVIDRFVSDENGRKLLLDLWLVMQAWDDAFDGDQADHAEAYRKAMISLPGNPLYIPLCIPLLVKLTYMDWMTANRFESERRDLDKAYVLRAGYYRIIIAVVAGLYGNEAAEKAAPDIWRCYGEKYKDYEAEICQIL